MKQVVFITGNKDKAEYLAKYLGHPVEHQKIEIEEIQSLDLRKVVKDKMRQAYAKIQKPVLVEDVALEFHALGRLPGTLIRWFIEELGFEKLCALVDDKDRSVTARCVFGYFDGQNESYFEGVLHGSIPKKPAGAGGYGWDSIFIPEGYDVTRAELGEEDYKKTYLKVKPLEKVKEFLSVD